MSATEFIALPFDGLAMPEPDVVVVPQVVAVADPAPAIERSAATLRHGSHSGRTDALIERAKRPRIEHHVPLRREILGVHPVLSAGIVSEAA